MYVLKLALQKLFSRPGNTAFSILLFAIGSSIISLIVIAEKNLNHNIERNFSGIDLVIGAKGSPLQLILSSVLHADYPTGNIRLQEAETIARNPLVKKAIPMALGDNYQGFRIVGTSLEYAALYDAETEKGEWYEEPLEAVLGAHVARTTGLQIGDRFHGVHGFQDTGHAHSEFQYTVTGILKSGAGIIDNLILTPVASVWNVHEKHHPEPDQPDHAHADQHHDNKEDEADHHSHARDTATQEPEEPALAAIRKKIDAGEDISREEMQLYTAHSQPWQSETEDDGREITAMLLQFRSPAGMIQLTRAVNETTGMQAAAPALEINRLLSLLSVGFDLLLILAWIIIAFSGINIFIHLWNTLRRERQDIALMRVMGATRIKVFLLLVVQGMAIALAGWMGGVLLSRMVWGLLPSFHFMTETGLVVLYVEESLLLIYALATGLLASLIPAWNAYKADVHFDLIKK